MELDTAPFHTVHSYPTNASIRLDMQYIIPRQSNKQSWIFDSGGRKVANKHVHRYFPRVNVSAMQHSVIASDNSEKIYLDNRELEGRAIELNTVAEIYDDVIENELSSTMCEITNLVRGENDVCQLTLECDNIEGINNETCLNPGFILCDEISTAANTFSQFRLNSMDISRLPPVNRHCLRCSDESNNVEEELSFTYQSAAKLITNYVSDNNDTACHNNSCNVNISCGVFEHSQNNISSMKFEVESDDYMNYTIKHLLNPLYSNATSNIFGNNTGNIHKEPCATPCDDIEQHQIRHNAAFTNWSFELSFPSLPFPDELITHSSQNQSGWANMTSTWSNGTLFWDEIPSDVIKLSETTAPVLTEYDMSFLFLTLFILVGGGGNILVCLSICFEKRLHNVTNYFLMSLAVADLLVSLVVMPFGAIAGFLGYWPFGLVWCNIYVSCDVLACTSSIMHMCTISLGRYMGIRNPLKTRNSSKKIVGIKVVLVWCSAMLVTSLITVLGIVDPLNIMPDPLLCSINNRAFFFVGSVCAFFVPMVIMVISYTLTVHLLRKKAKFSGDAPAGKARTMGRYRSVRRKNHVNNRPLRPYSYDERIELPRSYTNTNGNLYSIASSSGGPERDEVQSAEAMERDTRNFKLKALRLQLVGTAAWHLRFMATKKRDALAANAVATEQKASKVLGLVFFAFLICWTPFFVLNVYMAACPQCGVDEQLATMVLWLGYVSSTINPLIYTVFNRTFRSAFINILCCRYSSSNRVPRGFTGPETLAGCGGGTAMSHGPPPTTCSVHTLSTYVRSPSFPTQIASPTIRPLGQEHQM